MKFDNNKQAFFALVQAGLWEHDVRLSQFKEIDFKEIYRLAEEQSVVGLVAAGIEHVVNMKVPQEDALTFVGTALQLEQHNAAMNEFVANLVEKLRKADIYAILIKGQGVAQCYERPLWRAPGDVDLLLSNDNYEKAKSYLSPLVSFVDDEDKKRKHLAITMGSWIVELHGTFRTQLWKSLDNMIDDAQYDIFYTGSVRSWLNGNTQIFLPGVDEDVVSIFSHILQHFFVEGIGLRQVCDWVRFVYTYKERIDEQLLLKRLKSSRLLSKWKVFAALAVDYLGMPQESIPFYDHSDCWKRKAEKVLFLILDTGSFGQGRDKSYKDKYPYIKRMMISFCRHTKDGYFRAQVFPLDSLRTWSRTIINGVRND